jgi:hypothetical protein
MVLIFFFESNYNIHVFLQDSNNKVEDSIYDELTTIGRRAWLWI